MMTWEPAAKDKRVAVDDKRVDDEDVRQTTTIIGTVGQRQRKMIKQVAENCESGLRAGVCRRQTTDNNQPYMCGKVMHRPARRASTAPKMMMGNVLMIGSSINPESAGISLEST